MNAKLHLARGAAVLAAVASLAGTAAAVAPTAASARAASTCANKSLAIKTEGEQDPPRPGQGDHRRRRRQLRAKLTK